MASERFENLPSEKRRRILAAAMAEFSRVPFDEVSINQIIRAADIARGSFYEYFDGKRDLLEYIMQGFADKMSKAVYTALQESGGDVFAAVSALLCAMLAVGGARDNINFFRNIFSCARLSDFQSFKFSRLDVEELLQRFGGMLNLSRHREASRESLAGLMDILLTLLRGAVAQAYIQNQPPKAVQENFERSLRVIKYGALRETEEME